MFQSRLQKLQKLLLEQDIDLFLIENPVNIYYLTGIEVSTGQVIASSNHAFFLVDNRYFELCKKTSPLSVLLSSEVTIKSLLNSPEFRQAKTVGFDSENTSYKSYEELKAITDGLARRLVPTNDLVKKLRAVKDKNEIAILQEAAELGSLGFDYVCYLLKEGISEQEIALELEIFWKKRGGRKPAFDPIIAFGPNSSMPHYRASDTVLLQGQSVLIDIGVTWKHYHSDMTRVIFYGTPHPKILEIYEVVLEAQNRALEACKPGILVGQLDAIARDHIAEKGYGQYFVHSLGHGIGLEVHELPTIRNKGESKNEPLLEGMAITIEPGIYLPGLGGVRIEDTVVITKDGHENLTKRPKDILQLKK